MANLLENAFKYAQKDAEIGITMTSKGLCIFDDGKKITKNENEKIFQKGFRGSAAKTKDGTGVGLFLARKLAKQIGGFNGDACGASVVLVETAMLFMHAILV